MVGMKSVSIESLDIVSCHQSVINVSVLSCCCVVVLLCCDIVVLLLCYYVVGCTYLIYLNLPTVHANNANNDNNNNTL